MQLPDINNHTVSHTTAPTVDQQEVAQVLETKIQDLKATQEAILKANHQVAKTKVANNNQVANKLNNNNKTPALRAQTPIQDLTQSNKVRSKFSSLETIISLEISALDSLIDITRELPQ